ncbi:phospholipid-transporting ATPase ABCA1-like [Physella acuta]|uniref:phospholipid-transporting ATPase ABCA1-like n=1 Tax=Physella acuta TaxID=109671 RepID=UPI0027DC1CF6|nr:phospholipid-transporting ATPase ABCA1-like [Physella acuta]
MPGRKSVIASSSSHSTVEAATIRYDKNKAKGNNTTPVVSFQLDDVTTVPKHLKFFVVVDYKYHPYKVYGKSEILPLIPTFSNWPEVHSAMYQVTRLYMDYWQNRNGTEATMKQLVLTRMPSKPKHDLNRTGESTVRFMQSLLALWYMPLFCFATITLVEERERKIKESMKLMGLGESIYWMSWFAMNFIYGLFMSLLAFFVVYGNYSDSGPLFQSSSGLFVIFELWAVTNTITAAFLMSTFFKNGRLAGVLAVVYGFFVAPMVADIILLLDFVQSLVFPFGIVVFGFGLKMAINVLADLEESDRPIYFSTIDVNENDPNRTFLDALNLMMFNTVFNVFCVWYISNVFPGEYGIAKPLNFLFTRSYWVPTGVDEGQIPTIPPQDENYFEKPEGDLKSGIQVRNLIKMFGQEVAVAGLSMDVYEGQITVLLGHNGAGKTTTINMITGFLPPTSGTIMVEGLDMRKNTKAARTAIGLCPQQDILFPKLTCAEHMIFFLKIKGLYNEENVSESLKRLDAIGLGGEKMKCLASKLSDGQKRKLSLACAFSGNTKVLFLDEPSTGLDPAARQEMWAFLKTMREGRTILLTTHYMDEADVLGDRIAIMAEGRVKCCGTSMFLKRVYGTGYKLKIVKRPKCLAAKVTQQILKLIPQAQYISETNSEIDYLLPENMTEMYPRLLTVLEDDAEKLAINGFGLTATSMEDVFVKVGESRLSEGLIQVDNTDGKSSVVGDGRSPGDIAEVNTTDGRSTVVIEMTDSGQNESFESSAVDPPKVTQPQPTGTSVQPVDACSDPYADKIFRTFNECKSTTRWTIFIQQLAGIVVKKFILFRRNVVSSSILILLPVFFVAFGLYSDMQTTWGALKPMTYHPERLPNLITPFFTSPNTPKDLLDTYKKLLPNSEFIEPEYTNPLIYVRDWADANSQKQFDKMAFGVHIKDETLTEVLYNERLTHNPGLVLQLMLNAEVQHALGEDHTVQLGLQYFAKEDIANHVISTLYGVLFAMALLPVFFIYGLIVERATGAKHLQTLSGVHPVAYWLGTFVCDFLVFLAITIILLCMLTYNSKAFTDNSRWVVLLFGFLAFGIASFPYLYLLQNIFSTPSRGIVVLLVVNINIGIIVSLVITIFKFTGEKLDSTVSHLDRLFAYLSPNYSLSGILLMVSVNTQADEDFWKVTRASSSVVGSPYVDRVQSSQIDLELACGQKSPDDSKSVEEDADVINEHKRVHETRKEDLLTSDALLLIDLKKVYCNCCTTQTAVQPLSFGVPDKECLGLLGQNGAGKTTVFKILTGDITLSSGEAYVGGYNIKQHLKKVQSMMSYCPQVNALHDGLTGCETLYLYGRLRGVKEQYLSEITEIILDFITLRPHENKTTSTYSGGNKRKLSMGIAIIGDPHFIMLDEPTAGMDPISRRSLWQCLHMIRSMERTLVLTSHSMEECEALCTKIAILKKGRLISLGSTQHLKNKFAQGYTVILHAKRQEDGTIFSLKPAVDFLISSIPGTKVFNDQPSYCHLQIPETARLSEIFRLSLHAKSTFDLQHFTAQQTSLEQIFLLLMKD